MSGMASASVTGVAAFAQAGAAGGGAAAGGADAALARADRAAQAGARDFAAVPREALGWTFIMGLRLAVSK